jgi:hypothetical protein
MSSPSTIQPEPMQGEQIVALRLSAETSERAKG